jgi:U3 small nucleolar RNA-associated protein 25
LNREKEEESESFSSSEEELDEFETSEEEDEETVPTVSPYEALLQSFASETSRESKRRKIEHPRESGVIKNEEQDNELENQDAVDEAEEGPETAIEDALDEDEEDSSDPFGSHFADPEDNDLTRRLKAIQNNQWSTQRVTFPHLGNAILRIPQSGGSEVTNFPSISKPAELKLKQKLAVVATEQRSSFDILEQTIAPLIFNYQDVLYCERSLNNQDNLRRLASLHAVNHVFK